jgi:hypothetical protein
VNSVSWSNSFNLLISGSDDTSVKVWTTLDSILVFNGARPQSTRSLSAKVRRGNESSESEKSGLINDDYRS